ncbi:MAG TPA: aminoacyl-tRNA hydrolase [Dehalococcoidia bacterium]|nr:aminoacyl-tRNA hydrolase [Dehalococcoidia bacterium]
MKLIVGLGNPGQSYAHNRHNIGFRCLNHFARRQGIRFDSRWEKARLGQVAEGGVVLAKPQTFMNLSGLSVSRLVKKYDVALSDLLVVHDDLDLPLARIRLRSGGSSGGHKGVSSIISSLGTQDFPRLRVGIGRPAASENPVETDEGVSSYVLGDFTPEEARIVAQVIPRVSQAIVCFLTEGISSAMNSYN